jgi:hypothetical protein
MKRLVLTLTIALSLISLSSFKSADDSIAPDAAIKSFKSAFKSATEVSWSITDDLYKANFSLNGQYVSAFYDAEGQMVALTKNLTSLELPIALQAKLKKNYEGYWISDLIEVAREEGTSYYITLENADSKLILKSSGLDWSSYKKQRKS